MRCNPLLLLVLPVSALAASGPKGECDLLSLGVEQAGSLLETMDDEIFLECLRRSPKTSDPFLAVYLESQGEEATLRLLEPLLAKSDDRLAARAMRLCGRLAYPSLVRAVARRSGTDPAGADFLEAVTAIPTVEAEHRLADAIRNEEDLRRRYRLLRALSAIASEESRGWLMRVLREGDAEERRLAAEGLTRAPSAKMVSIVSELLAKPCSLPLRRALLGLLGAASGQKELNILNRCLGSPKPLAERAACLEALALSPRREATVALVGIIRSQRSDLEREAIMALSGRDDDVARTALLDMIKEEENPVRLRFEFTALGKLGEKRAIPKMKKACSDPNVAYFAALALARLGEDAGREVLESALRFSDYREEALRALAEVGDESSARAIRKIYPEEKRANVRALAVESLLRIEGKM